MTISTTLLGRHVGARIDGIDLRATPDEETIERLENLLERHGVLVFPGQQLKPREQARFTRAFGPLLRSPRTDGRHPDDPDVFVVGNSGATVITFSPAKPDGDLEWHTDQIHRPVTARASLLFAVQIPPSGGDTLFACTRASYDALPKSERQRLAKLQAVHSPAGLRRYLSREGRSGNDDEVYEARDCDVRWPLVRRHPRSGRQSLYFGAYVTVGIEGLDHLEARTLIDQLSSHVTQAEFRYRHRWQVGDAVLWDNRRVLHAGTWYDTAKHRRLLHRTMLRETEPIG